MSCLNCGGSATDRFCASCGQRVLPPYPTMREMIGDTWAETIGYDGRFLRTIRLLLLHPGQLTNEVLRGRAALAYTIVAIHRVYGERWPRIILTLVPMVRGLRRGIRLAVIVALVLAASR